MKLFGVIMAGGSGTRFWPLSRKNHPKQLLNLSGDGLMLNKAIDRLSYTVEPQNILVATGADHQNAVLEATAGRILPGHVLVEPSPRSTAACIGYAAMAIVQKCGDGLMIVTPSDAHIKDTPAFSRALAQAVQAAQQGNWLVTIGIAPSFASTAYGYIRCKDEPCAPLKAVSAFREKPDQKTAESYVKSGEYLWNSGMFIWKASVILAQFEKFAPDLYDCLRQIGSAMNTDREAEVLEQVYPGMRSISIDYAIMEPAAAQGNVLVVPGSFGWSDVGTWDMMHMLYPTDENDNILIGDAMAVDSSGCLLCSSDRLVAALGVEDLVVVDTPDALLVCSRDRAQDVRQIVDRLKKDGRSELL